jgi:hypothetical protein
MIGLTTLASACARYKNNKINPIWQELKLNKIILIIQQESDQNWDILSIMIRWLQKLL